MHATVLFLMLMYAAFLVASYYSGLKFDRVQQRCRLLEWENEKIRKEIAEMSERMGDLHADLVTERVLRVFASDSAEREIVPRSLAVVTDSGENKTGTLA